MESVALTQKYNDTFQNGTAGAVSYTPFSRRSQSDIFMNATLRSINRSGRDIMKTAE